MKFLLFLSLVFTFELSISYGNNDLVDIDYFHLVLQWPKSYCNTGKVTCYYKPPNWFTIHGIWPQKDGYTVPCPKVSKGRYFDLEKLDGDLIATMEYHWPSLIEENNPKDQPFWRHEWNAHGSCTSFTQVEYFQKVVSKAAEHGLYSTLDSAGIQPGMPTYSMDIKDEIKKAFKLTPQIRCNTDQFNRLQLYEIAFCVDKTGTQFQNCNYKATCVREPFQFPQASSD